jgi:hypothetical protein
MIARGRNAVDNFVCRIYYLLKPQITWRGLWPQPNSKYEYRNTKEFQMTKNSMLQTLRKPHPINVLRLCSLKNEHKKQKVDGL